MTGTVTVTNNAEERLSLQLFVYSWTQDADGNDQFLPTEDIIVFPKIFSLGTKEERTVRVGTKVPPGESEKAYRLFLEELPQAETEPQAETVLRTLIRVGVPIFIAPIEEKIFADIEDVSASKGEFSFTIRNTGNVHFMIQGVTLTGKDASGATLFQKELSGWYLHGGNSRRFITDIPEEQCTNIKSLDIAVTTNKVSLDRQLDASEHMCTK